MERKFWLFKSEPLAYSLDDLFNEDDQTAEWDGVRNYQVRNFMRDEMKVGDAGFVLPQQCEAYCCGGYCDYSRGILPRCYSFGVPKQNITTPRLHLITQSGWS
ncbi:MAG: hypothetical protein CM1200mP35_03860 [Chloroflexota bacterium]|nr:MAG: hypothetical protein CM1200mP35_03860 [Chloroflexota bacterium]